MKRTLLLCGLWLVVGMAKGQTPLGNGYEYFKLPETAWLPTYFDFLDSFFHYSVIDTSAANNRQEEKVHRRMHRWVPRLYPTGDATLAAKAAKDWVQNGVANDWKNYNPNWKTLGPIGAPNNVRYGQVHRVTFNPFFNGTSCQTIYAAVTSGGLWRSQDNGLNWDSTGVDTLPVCSAADVAVSHQDTNIIWIATGGADEGNSLFANSVSSANAGAVDPLVSWGVYRSMDNTNTWQPMHGQVVNANGQLTSRTLLDDMVTGGTDQSATMHRLIVNPFNHDIILVATSKGVYRCANARAANPIWQNVLNETSNNIAQPHVITIQQMRGLAWHPTNPNVVYASGQYIHRSDDGGLTWTQIFTIADLPAGFIPRRINLAVSTNASAGVSDNLYAQVFGMNTATTTASIIYKLDSITIDTVVWQRTRAIDGNHSLLAISVDPTNENLVYIGGVYAKTVNFNNPNATPTTIMGSGIHADIHDLKFPPYSASNNNFLHSGHDGGYSIRTQSTGNWAARSNGLNTSLYWAYDDWELDTALNLIALQDNGMAELYTDSRLYTSLGGGGDGYGAQINNITGQRYYKNNNVATPAALNTLVFANNGVNLVNFTAMNDMHTDELYFGGFNSVYQQVAGTNGSVAAHWTNATDLPTFLLDTTPFMIVKMAIAPQNANNIYLLSSGRHPNGLPTGGNGQGREEWHRIHPRLFRSQNGWGQGTASAPRFIEISNNLPRTYCVWNGTTNTCNWFTLPITSLMVSDANPNRIWITFSGYEAGSKVFFSNDGGNTWQNGDPNNTLPNSPVNHAVMQTGTNDRIYLGTDVGLFVRNTVTGRWERYANTNDFIPNTQIQVLKINTCTNKLKVATWGRGLWEADLLPLETDNLQVISSSATWNNERVLQMGLRITNGATLVIKNVVSMPKDSRIVVEPGASLAIDGGTITNLCGHTWQGIEVQGNRIQAQTFAPSGNTLTQQGLVVIKNNGTISYAKNAVSTQHGGAIIARDARFINNWRAVEFSRYQVLNANGVVGSNKSGFFNCTFRVDDSYRAFNSADKFKGFISAWEVFGIKIQNSVFENNGQTNAVFQSSNNMGYGIYSLGAGYTVNNCQFKGLRYGVNMGASGNTLSYTNLQTNSFVGNHTGVVVNGQNVLTVRNNQFTVGTYRLNDIALNTLSQEGVVLNGTPNFTVQNNTFTVPSVRNTNYWQIGIRAYNTGRIDKTIYKNVFNGLLAASLAQGQNGINRGTFRSGLQYQCNSFNNSTAYDIVLDNALSNSALAPSQGSTSKAAGNKFNGSPLIAQLQYGANGNPATRLQYYYGTGQNEFPNLVVNANRIFVNDSTTCPDLRMSSLATGTQTFANSKEQYTQYLQQYNALLDDGKTRQLLDQVQRARAQNANGAKQKVNRAAPYLSVAVAKAFVLNTAFTTNDVKNMLLANPELMQADDIRQWVIAQNRLNNNQLATVLVNSDTMLTNRGILEANLQNAHLYMQLAANEMTEYYLNTTDSVDYDSVAIWLLRKETLVGAYQLVELDWQQRNYSTAFNKLASIPLDYQLDSVEQFIYNDYFALRNLIFSAESQGRELNQLNTSEQQVLKNIATRNEHYPNFQARAIENYFYGKNWTTKPEFPSIGVQMRAAQPTEIEPLPQPQVIGEFNDWAIYPNPAQNNISINLPKLETESSLKIVNLSGQVVYNQVLNPNVSQVQINVSHLANGLYVLSIENGTTRWAKNLVIQR